MQHNRPTTETEPTGWSMYSPAATQFMNPTRRFCRSCGADLPRSARRCAHCGQPLSARRC